MICKTVNIKRNMPLVSQAMTQLGNEIWMAKYARCHALKVIHGYGSSGQGGAIKAACLKLCANRKKSGVTRHYGAGRTLTPSPRMAERRLNSARSSKTTSTTAGRTTASR